MSTIAIIALIVGGAGLGVVVTLVWLSRSRLGAAHWRVNKEHKFGEAKTYGAVKVQLEGEPLPEYWLFTQKERDTMRNRALNNPEDR